MDARAIIGWNMRRLRVALGLSQERLALAADIDRAYVGRIERGKENVTLAVIEALAKALSVPVAALLVEPAPDEPLPKPLRPGPRARRNPMQA